MNSLRRRIDRFCVLHPNFGIPNLMLYIVIGNIAFYLLSLFSTLDGGSFYSILSFSWAGLKQGQLWRLLSFSFLPMTTSPFWLLVSCYFYYWIGSTLEREWGTAKFTIYYLSGVLLTALGATITSLITGYDWQVAGAEYVNLAMFFAFATLYPDAQVLLFFFIPVKIKWMAILDACYFAYIIFFCAVSRYWIGVVLPLVALLNFFVFFGAVCQAVAEADQAGGALPHRRPSDAARAAEPGLPPQVRGLRPHRCHESGAAVPLLLQVRGLSLLLLRPHFQPRPLHGRESLRRHCYGIDQRTGMGAAQRVQQG